MSVGEGVGAIGISLCVKYKASRMLPSCIFWWGYSCDRGKTKSTPSPRLWTLDWSLTKTGKFSKQFRVSNWFQALVFGSATLRFFSLSELCQTQIY